MTSNVLEKFGRLASVRNDVNNSKFIVDYIGTDLYPRTVWINYKYSKESYIIEEREDISPDFVCMILNELKYGNVHR